MKPVKLILIRHAVDFLMKNSRIEKFCYGYLIKTLRRPA